MGDAVLIVGGGGSVLLYLKSSPKTKLKLNDATSTQVNNPTHFLLQALPSHRPHFEDIFEDIFEGTFDHVYLQYHFFPTIVPHVLGRGMRLCSIPARESTPNG